MQLLVVPTFSNWANLVQNILVSLDAKKLEWDLQQPYASPELMVISKPILCRWKESYVFSISGVIPVNWNLLPRQMLDKCILLAPISDKRLPRIGCESFIRFTFWWDCAESFSVGQWFSLANTVIKQGLLLPSAETNQFKNPLGNSLFPLYRPGSRPVSFQQLKSSRNP